MLVSIISVRMRRVDVEIGLGNGIMYEVINVGEFVEIYVHDLEPAAMHLFTNLGCNAT